MVDIMNREPMLEMFIFETTQMIESLELIILSNEKQKATEESIHEIFRIMHSIKGSAAMMFFDNISSLAHALEDIFFCLRENKPSNVEYEKLTDIILESIDFIKSEIEKIKKEEESNTDSSHLIKRAHKFLDSLGVKFIEKRPSEEMNQKQKFYISSSKSVNTFSKIQYKAVIFFEEDCEMENLRAFTVLHSIKEISDEAYSYPEDLINDEESIDLIRKEGFVLLFSTKESEKVIRDKLEEAMFVKKFNLELVLEEESPKDRNEEYVKELDSSKILQERQKESLSYSSKQNLMSVSVPKMDQLLDLVGELVISEAMVTQHPELNGLELEGFYKAARQLKKITNELQDIVMSIRMVPLAMTFRKMHRVVRDMSKKLDKEIKLEIIGEETEVDKNIIEKISDPLMHIIRNAIDHGIESREERINKNKNEIGNITLEAKNAGGDVWIIIKDDGQGLDKEKILKKARKSNLIYKPENELSDREIYSLICIPGFSTNEVVTEFSGRGVGMDVVVKNIENIGGTVIIDSERGMGSTVSIKIPLTLAIIDGMTMEVGNARYTIPVSCIKEAFKAEKENIIKDPDGNEMIFSRKNCYPILRLHERYRVNTGITNIYDGILIMIENGLKRFCIFADKLLGEQQVVVKSLPNYLKKVDGLSGCSLLGDGSISLILDIESLF